MKCKICGKELKDIVSLAKHIKIHSITSKQYYDTYLKKESEGICLMYGQISSCKKHTNYGNIIVGYRKYCSNVCINQDPNIQKKIQSKIDYESRNQKIKETCKIRYGKENVFQITDIQDKQKNTVRSRYNCNNASQIQKVRDKKSRDNIQKFLPHLLEELHEKNIELIDSEYKQSHVVHNWKCLKCNRIFKTCWNAIQQEKYKCPKCYPRSQSQSKGEIELGDWIKSLGFSITQRDRSIIGKEIDIYIPSLKVGIEYDGLWFHSKDAQNMYYPYSNEDPKTKQLIKTELCNEKNIQLIHIFDDEWLLYQDQIKELLRKILFENYDLIQNDCDMITLNRRFSKNSDYYQELGYEVNIIGPKLYPNKEEFKVWDVGYLVLTKKE